MITKRQYRGWTIKEAVWGWCATHDVLHDDSGRWQVNGSCMESTMAEIGEIMDERQRQE